MPLHFQVPNTEEEWKAIADQYLEKWNFNNCIGAMDGKHVLINPPANSGSLYFNYKGSFSIVLLALVDADYKFLYVDVGCNGRISDGGVFKNSSLYRALEDNSLHIPGPGPLPGSNEVTPHVIVADDAFPLKTYIQKPYSRKGLTQEQRIFNYRLSRARRVSENVFGIFANRFRVFMLPMNLVPEKVELVVLACVALHNFLRTKLQGNSVYMPPGFIDTEDRETNREIPGSWRSEPQPQGLLPISLQGSNHCSANAKAVRDTLCKYFCSENGEVPWQWAMV